MGVEGIGEGEEGGDEVGGEGDDEVSVDGRDAEAERGIVDGVGIEECGVYGCDAVMNTDAVDGTGLRVTTGNGGKARFGVGDAGGGGPLGTGLRARGRTCPERSDVSADASRATRCEEELAKFVEI